MKKIKIFSTSGFSLELEYEKQIELYIDIIPKDPVPNNTIRFVFLLEPPEIIDLSQVALLGLKNNTYNHLMTHNQSLLDATDKAQLFEFGTSWIHDYDNTTSKKFQISHLTGFKEITNGHMMRKKIHYKQGKISTPKDFYISRHGGVDEMFDNKILGDSKNPLFESQFHICIENAKRQNWFTEKLIDCLVTKTIPIYWGCENIEKFFDINGLFIAKDFNDIIKICNSLNEKTYDEKLKYVNNNFELSQKYINILDRIEIVINQILKSK